MTRRARLQAFGARRIGIIGDVMLDHFIVGRTERISPEAPVPVLRLEREDFRLGGAANVAANVAALGGEATLVGLVGDDAAGRHLAEAMTAAGLDASGLILDATRPTTEKIRAVTVRHQQVARIDRESSAPAAGPALGGLLARIATLSRCQAIVVSDYAKGVVTEAVMEAAALAAAAAACPLIVDPKRSDASAYRGATVITPNHHEAELMTGLTIRDHNDARTAARRIHEACGAAVLITRGEHGMWVFDPSGGAFEEAAIPATAREVSDVTGAGDTVVATLALACAAGASLAEAAHVANVAAGISVSRFGPAAVTLAELTALVSD